MTPNRFFKLTYPIWCIQFSDLNLFFMEKTHLCLGFSVDSVVVKKCVHDLAIYLHLATKARRRILAHVHNFSIQT